MNTKARIAKYLQQKHTATRPEISRALGISLVSTNNWVSILEKEGVLTAGRSIPSGGGRPVREYHFAPRHAVVALITATQETHCTRLQLELLNLEGTRIEQTEARFAQVHTESLDEWLDAAARQHKLHRICVPPELGSKIQHHLKKRLGCPVQEYSIAESLITRKHPDTLALVLRQGKPPQGARLLNDHITTCPLLQHLPLPADWENMDYADHTLVEEMLARLLHILTCTLNPAHIELHADFWNDRLISRLNFNLSTKLRNLSHHPQLHYIPLLPDKLSHALHKSVTRY